MTVLRSEKHFILEMGVAGDSFDRQNCRNNSFELIFLIQLHHFDQIIPIWTPRTSGEVNILSVIEDIVHVCRKRNSVREDKSIRRIEMVNWRAKRALFNNDQFFSELPVLITCGSYWYSRGIAKIVFGSKLTVAFIAVAKWTESDEGMIFQETEESLSYWEILK